MPQEFVVSIGDDQLSDLRRRLGATRWPRSAQSGWTEGTDPEYLADLVAYWLEHFDWRSQEQRLNRHHQVVVDIGDAEIHTIHQRGIGPDPLPLLMSHGWPSTFAEWSHVVDALANPGAHGGDPADAFHVVAPSLPGYGFSTIGSSPGTSPRVIAAMWMRLMSELGYDRFAAHGCDWGAYITALLALNHPSRVVGAHMGMVSLGAPATDGRQTSEADDEYVRRVRRWRDHEHGYVAIQSTKPASLAVGLNDSPAGLAAWIAEKWRAWSDCGGDPETAINRDDLLTAISLYWFTGSIGTASRLYLESAQDPVRLASGQRVEVPCGFLLEAAGDDASTFLNAPRIGAPPRGRAEQAFDIHRWTIVDRGGHFPALEIPDVFVREVREFFRPLRRR